MAAAAASLDPPSCFATTVVTKSASQRRTTAQISKEKRDKKRHEYEELKHDNAFLKQERQKLIAQMEELETSLVTAVSQEDPRKLI
jgi:hypothetical protein